MSGSDMDEKKIKRMLSNRESARRSRLKRQKHLEELIKEKVALEKRIEEEQQKYVSVCQSHLTLKVDNETLREEKGKLVKYLMDLNRMIGIYENSIFSSHDQKVETADSLMNSWQTQRLSEPVTALGLFTS